MADTHANRPDTQSDNEDETLNLTDLLVNQLDMPIPINIEELFEPEDTNDHLHQYKSVANKTCLASVSPQSQMENECINIAPGDDRQPKSILNDKFCEELNFPHLFQTGKFGYKVKRKINLRPMKYFNQNLLHFSQKFRRDAAYIFFARYILQNLNMQEQIQINVAMRKISTPAKDGFLNNTSFMEAVQEYYAISYAIPFFFCRESVLKAGITYPVTRIN